MTPMYLINVVQHTNQDAVTVYWTTVPSAQQYKLQYRELGSDTWSPESNTLRNYRKIFSLTENTEYEVQFSAKVAGVWQDWSETFNFTCD